MARNFLSSLRTSPWFLPPASAILPFILSIIPKAETSQLPRLPLPRLPFLSPVLIFLPLPHSLVLPAPPDLHTLRAITRAILLPQNPSLLFSTDPSLWLWSPPSREFSDAELTPLQSCCNWQASHHLIFNYSLRLKKCTVVFFPHLSNKLLRGKSVFLYGWGRPWNIGSL